MIARPVSLLIPRRGEEGGEEKKKRGRRKEREYIGIKTTRLRIDTV